MEIIIAKPLYPPEIENLSTYSQVLAEQLKSEHQVTVLAYANQVEKIKGLNIITVNKRQPLAIRILKYTIQLWKLSARADIIYVQNAVACGWPAVFIIALRKIPLIVNFAEDEAWKRALHLRLTNKNLSEFLTKPDCDTKTRRLIKIQTCVLRRADKIIVASKKLAEIVHEHYHVAEKKIIVNYQPTAEPLILPFDIKIISEQIFINSKLFTWAGLDNLIQLINELKLKFPQLKLIIAGDGPAKDSLKKLVQDLSITDKVVFKGRISRAENQYLEQTSQVVLTAAEKYSLAQMEDALRKNKTDKVKITWASHLEKLNVVFNLAREKND